MELKEVYIDLAKCFCETMLSNRDMLERGEYNKTYIHNVADFLAKEIIKQAVLIHEKKD